MKKIFITGGGGYVGCALTDYLISKGYFVSVFDLFIYGKNVFNSTKNLMVRKQRSLLDQRMPEIDSRLPESIS